MGTALLCEELIRRRPGALPGDARLDLVTMEEVVLLAAGAVRALHAADEEHGHAHRNQDGKYARVDHEPMHQATHIGNPIPIEAESAVAN